MLLPLLLLAALPQDLVENGAADGLRGWSATGGDPAVRHDHDRTVGAKAPGSLRIVSTLPPGKRTSSWIQRIALPEKDRPQRLALRASVRLADADAQTGAGVMLQILPSEGGPIGYARATPTATAEAGWTEGRGVFDVPAEATHLLILCYLNGEGAAHFDDVSIMETDDPVTGPRVPAVGADPRLEKLVRGAAADLPWLFDGDEARARAAELGRPILVYLRCTDHRESLASAQASIEAPDVRFYDDGYLKDMLFRAGPLSHPDVAAVIRRRFVPVCLTYELAGSARQTGTVQGWGRSGFGTAELTWDEAEACLVIRNEDPDDHMPHQWMQALDWDSAEAVTLRLTTRMKTTDFAEGTAARVLVQCWGGSDALAYGGAPQVMEDTDWTETEDVFEVPAGVDKLRILAFLSGAGEVRFADVVLSRADEGAPNLLATGDEKPRRAFGGLEIDAATTTTPALVVLEADGTARARLHRIGTLSDDLVDRWLREVLDDLGEVAEEGEPEDLYLDGRIDELLAVAKGTADPDDKLLRARGFIRAGDLRAASRILRSLSSPAARTALGLVRIRAGEWYQAEKELAAVVEDGAGEEARFLLAWARHRMGRVGEAEEGWRELVGETPWGRKAAACLLVGPTLPYAASMRAWPAWDELPEQSEWGEPGPFDPSSSVRRLLEMQRPDASFRGQVGPGGVGYSDPAITALCVEALDAWRKPLPGTLRIAASAARDRALENLERWAAAHPPGPPSQAFNDAYVLSTLVRHDRLHSAQKLIAPIAASQLPDGNWTVYHVERPASFNTALLAIALTEAKAAKIELPDGLLTSALDAIEAMRQRGGLFPYSTGPGHEWMTTPHGSIARDSLCEYVLLLNGRSSKESLAAALERYVEFGHELRLPTKRLYDYFNSRGHGGYYFFFAHRNAAMAAREFSSGKLRRRTIAFARDAVLSAGEGDGTYMDKFLLGRAYGTAMALLILAE